MTVGLDGCSLDENKNKNKIFVLLLLLDRKVIKISQWHALWIVELWCGVLMGYKKIFWTIYIIFLPSQNVTETTAQSLLNLLCIKKLQST